MKKWLCLIVVAILTFLLNEHVYANIDETTAEIECIYGTGVAVSLTRDPYSKVLSAHIKEYPVNKSVEISGDPISNISLFDGEGSYRYENVNPLKKLVCPEEIKVWKIVEATKEEGSGWIMNVKGVYSFKYYYQNNKSNTITNYYGGIAGRDNSSGWLIFGEAATKKTAVVKLFSNSPIESSPEVTAPLVAERIYITDDLEKEDYTVSYKSAASETIGSNSYIQFFESENGTLYVKKGKTMTSLSNGKRGLIGSNELCFKESVMEQDSSRTDFSYKVNSIRHEIHNPLKGGLCYNGYVLYKLDDTICEVDPQESESKKSFCDEYGNTAKVLARIINIMQIVVPALVLVLTAVEITRIVLAGNVEEELPKRKKSIIIRLIIMCVFLFLPVITQLIINLINDKDIYDISCLFNNGVTEEKSDDCIELDN